MCGAVFAEDVGKGSVRSWPPGTAVRTMGAAAKRTARARVGFDLIGISLLGDIDQ